MPLNFATSPSLKMLRCRVCYSFFNTDEGVMAHIQRSRDPRCHMKLSKYLLSAVQSSLSSLPNAFEQNEQGEVLQASNDSEFEGDYFEDDYEYGDLSGLDGSAELDIVLEVGGDDLGLAMESEVSDGELEYGNKEEGEEEEEEEAEAEAEVEGEEEEEEYLWCATILLLCCQLLD